MPSVTLIVSTHNNPDVLRRVLEALQCQSDQVFELIIADDGSTEETAQLVELFNDTLRCTHLWQEDDGFRKSVILNKAILKATGDTLAFLDGDCIPRTHFIRHVKSLAAKNSVIGCSRILLDQTISQHFLDNDLKPHRWPWYRFMGIRISGHINRILPLVPLPLGLARNLLPASWKKIRGCNFVIDATLMHKIGGFDESFTGWGYEDSDVAARAVFAGGKLRRGDFKATVLHMWHHESQRDESQSNFKRLEETIALGRREAILGLKKPLSPWQ